MVSQIHGHVGHIDKITNCRQFYCDLLYFIKYGWLMIKKRSFAKAQKFWAILYYYVTIIHSPSRREQVTFHLRESTTAREMIAQ